MIVNVDYSKKAEAESSKQFSSDTSPMMRKGIHIMCEVVFISHLLRVTRGLSLLDCTAVYGRIAHWQTKNCRPPPSTTSIPNCFASIQGGE